jgi:hypothetical protein
MHLKFINSTQVSTLLRKKIILSKVIKYSLLFKNGSEQ